MTDGACAWLPANALTDERMRDDFNQVVVASIEEKTSPAARKSPASIPKSWGRE